MANLRGWITHLGKLEDLEALVHVPSPYSVGCIWDLSFDDGLVEVFRMSNCAYVRLLVGRFSAAAETGLFGSNLACWPCDLMEQRIV